MCCSHRSMRPLPVERATPTTRQQCSPHLCTHELIGDEHKNEHRNESNLVCWHGNQKAKKRDRNPMTVIGGGEDKEPPVPLNHGLLAVICADAGDLHTGSRGKAQLSGTHGVKYRTIDVSSPSWSWSTSASGTCSGATAACSAPAGCAAAAPSSGTGMTLSAAQGGC